jgi:hypothetical protein
MKIKLIAVSVLAVALTIGYAYGKGGGHSGGYHTGSGHSSGHTSGHSSGHSSHWGHSSYHYHAPAVHRVSTYSGHTFHTAHYATGYVGARDAEGRIVRSESAKRDFMRMTGYPHGRPGYVVDHVIALKRGGADDPSNMQWQTIAEGKAKDKWE